MPKTISSARPLSVSVFVVALLLSNVFGNQARADENETLVFYPPAAAETAKHIVLVSGDEEYRSEETMPMLGKILSQKHGFKCTVVFAFSEDGSYIDPNNQQGLRGLAALDSADLMIIGTRYRQPSEGEAAHLVTFMDAGKPIIGIRTSTHAFNGKGSFGNISYGDWGFKILGERWVRHHGAHKVQGARGVNEAANARSRNTQQRQRCFRGQRCLRRRTPD